MGGDEASCTLSKIHLCKIHLVTSDFLSRVCREVLYAIVMESKIGNLLMYIWLRKYTPSCPKDRCLLYVQGNSYLLQLGLLR